MADFADPFTFWEGVRDPHDHRKTVYWRLMTAEGHSLGAISRKDVEWRALAYDPKRKRSDIGRVELGMFPTKAKGQAAVVKDWRDRTLNLSDP